MIRAILYDLGDIFFEAHFWRKWMFEKLSEDGYFSKTFSEFYDLYEEFLLPVYKNEMKYDDAYFNFLNYLKHDNPVDFKEESFEKKLYFETNRTLYDGVKETLQALKDEGIQNIVITDNESGEETVRSKVIGKYNINHLVDKVVTSKEVGKTKPSPEIFQFALDWSGFSKDEVIFVAHDQDEIDGAKSLGLKVCEYNNYLNRETKADFKIKDFREILNLL